jgi:hypothetical protein
VEDFQIVVICLAALALGTCLLTRAWQWYMDRRRRASFAAQMERLRFDYDALTKAVWAPHIPNLRQACANLNEAFQGLKLQPRRGKLRAERRR